jgi:hypothetical protein
VRFFAGIVSAFSGVGGMRELMSSSSVIGPGDGSRPCPPGKEEARKVKGDIDLADGGVDTSAAQRLRVGLLCQGRDIQVTLTAIS